jgi:hypothetical protein
VLCIPIFYKSQKDKSQTDRQKAAPALGPRLRREAGEVSPSADKLTLWMPPAKNVQGQASCPFNIDD